MIIAIKIDEIQRKTLYTLFRSFFLNLLRSETVFLSFHRRYPQRYQYFHEILIVVCNAHENVSDLKSLLKKSHIFFDVNVLSITIDSAVISVFHQTS